MFCEMILEMYIIFLTGQEAPFNVMAIEKWPIIQAFALDDFGG